MIYTYIDKKYNIVSEYVGSLQSDNNIICIGNNKMYMDRYLYKVINNNNNSSYTAFLVFDFFAQYRVYIDMPNFKLKMENILKGLSL